MTLLATEPDVYELSDLELEDLELEAPDWRVEPFTLGPTWDRDPRWTGPRTKGEHGFILPEHTIGWQVIDWIEANLLADEVDEKDQPLPFKLTEEQQRFLLWFYAVDETGRFLYREIVLQRLKGWGKDPLAACIAAVEFVGPCRFAGWVTFSKDPELRERQAAKAASEGLSEGDPYAKPHPRAWIQIAAVSLIQTQNTMLLFQGLFSPECMAEHGIDMGKETIYAYGGKKKIQAVTSSPRSLEGNRPTLVIKNETHHWLQNNEGHAMADAIERNATKAKGGAARTLSITNAYEPSEESVAQAEREAWEAQEAGLAMKTGTLYDSLEAPRTARLRPKLPEEMEPEERETLTRRYLTRVLEKVRGDAIWLDIPSLVNSILNPKNRASRSRRFWFNQITASEDVWVNPLAVDAAIPEAIRQARLLADSDSKATLEAGWLVKSTEPCVMFFDGSKSDDATALVGCRISDGFIFTIGVWQKPRGDRGKNWLAPRDAVDARVKEAFTRFNIIAFWADPSHAKDDEDDSRYWDGYIDRWMRDNKAKLDPRFWPVKSGLRQHAVMFDMTDPSRTQAFIADAERFVQSMERLNDVDEFEPEFFIDGHPALITHLKNAIRHPHPKGWGISLMKDHRESERKIDLAVCAVGASMLRRIVLNSEEVEEVKQPGEIWGVGW